MLLRSFLLATYFLLFLSGIANAQSLATVPLAFRERIYQKDFELKGKVRELRECMYRFDDVTHQPLPDYTTNHYFFNANGSLLRTDNLANAKSTDPFTTRFYYFNDRPDSIIGGRDHRFYYSKTGQLEQINISEASKKEPIVSNQFTYQDGQIIRQVTTDHLSKATSVSTFSYDKSNRILSIRSVMKEDELNYTNNYPKPSQIIATAVYKNDKKNNYTSESKLNERGDIVEYVLRQASGTTTYKYEYLYDEYNNWIRQTTYYNGKIVDRRVREIQYESVSGKAAISADKLMPANRVAAYTAQPHEVMARFFSALDRQDFDQAYALCTGSRWGTLAYFRSTASYGGISAVKVNSIEQKFGYMDDATLNCVTTVTDKVNGTGTFKQLFILKKQPDNTWKITGIKLLESSRGADNWNLRADPPGDFTLTDVRRLSRSVYDTMKNPSYTESPDDTMKRSFKNLSFIKTDKGLYAIAICENKGPDYGVYSGWCDVLAFRKEGDQWKLSGTLLQAGGGGRMGYPGRFERIVRVGDYMAGIVISSYMGHMGAEHIGESVIVLEDGKLDPLFSISVSLQTDNSFSTPSFIANEYRFEKNGKAVYDLILTQFDMKGAKPKKIKTIRIPYKSGYAVPDDYQFEM